MYDYNSGYYATSYGYNEAVQNVNDMASTIAVMSLVISLISLVISIVTIVSMWKIFKKAGKKGWEAIIPIYNTIVLLEIVELPTWYIVLFFIPFANIYAMFKIYIELAHKFGKSTGFGVASVFFGFICMPILAFGKSTYEGNTISNTNYQNSNNISQPSFGQNQMVQSNMNEQVSQQNYEQAQGTQTNVNSLEQSHKFCPKCGNKIDISNDTCFMCGHKF